MDNVLAVLYVLIPFTGLLSVAYWAYAFHQRAVRDRFAARPTMLGRRHHSLVAPVLDEHGKIVGAPPTRWQSLLSFVRKWRSMALEGMQIAYTAVVAVVCFVPEAVRVFWREYKSYKASWPQFTDEEHRRTMDRLKEEAFERSMKSAANPWTHYDAPSKSRQHLFPPRAGVVTSIDLARRRRSCREVKVSELVTRQAD